MQGKPKAGKGKARGPWRAAVQEEAQKELKEAAQKELAASGLPIFSDAWLHLGVYFVYPPWVLPSEPRLGDLDNLALPIMDALKDVIYEDDRQVAELWLRRILLSAGPEYEGWPERLKQAVEVEREEFTYIQIDVMPEREVFL